ncbi:hypothetical protein [Phyllobacterium bourgognense]|uniref:TetR family transcriptional regulator n=1 Tax=Phyllobacterium bourgognense TaxID=314236 RepID=A0A368YQJ5_9HYPH|nr:hypothetical protein [Phyllobacterium bourgognense]RCW81197.1 hypothetical protein C7476_11159 [Phyllobacterium bourgognense]
MRPPDAHGVAQATRAARAEALAQFVALLDVAKENGDVPGEADNLALARFYMAVVQGMAVQARDGADVDTLGTLVDSYRPGLHIGPPATDPGCADYDARFLH